VPSDFWASPFCLPYGLPDTLRKNNDEKGMHA